MNDEIKERVSGKRGNPQIKKEKPENKKRKPGSVEPVICAQCGFYYQADATKRKSKCPRCGHINLISTHSVTASRNSGVNMPLVIAVVILLIAVAVIIGFTIIK
jgi:phage FluMu protein Com